MKITIILPTYNEAENIPRLVDAIFSLPRSDIHLLFIDDNSPDGTGKIIDRLVEEHPSRIRVIHREGKMGLGSAYILGFQSLFDTDVDVIGYPSKTSPQDTVYGRWRPSRGCPSIA
jgi:dolichol-phosphate mannosyltransferase